MTQMSAKVEQIYIAGGVNKIALQKAEEPQEKDILLLEDLILLFDMLSISTKMTGEIKKSVKLTNESQSFFVGIFNASDESDPLKRTLEAIPAVINILIPRKEKELQEDILSFTKMKQILEKAQRGFSKIEQELSSDSAITLEEFLSAIEGPFGILEIPNYLKSTIQNTCLSLSGSLKQKGSPKGMLEIGKPGWAEKLSKEDVKRVLSKLLRSKKPKVQKVTTKVESRKKPEKVEEKSFWEKSFRAKLESGYSGVSGEAGAFSDRPRGVILNSEVEAILDISKKWNLGLVYHFEGPIDPKSDSKVVYVSDDARVFGDYLFNENFKLRLELGGGYYRYDQPSPLFPNKEIATQGLSLKWRFRPTISGDFGLRFEEGQAGMNEKKVYFKSEASLSFSFHLLEDKLVPRLGAFISHDNLAHGLPFGISAGADYSFGKGWEIGLNAGFINYPSSEKYLEKWRIDSEARFKIPLWNNLKLNLFGGVMYGEIMDGSVSGWKAGAGLSWEGINNGF